MRMKDCLHFCKIFFVMMLLVIVTQANVVHHTFKELEAGKNITGAKGAEPKARSPQECALRCLSSKECKAYQYQESKEATCMLIYKNCGGGDGQVFQQSDKAQIYEIDFVGKTIWNKPPDWSGPEAAFYESFDTSDGLVSWEGTNQTCNVPLVSGKVNMALTLNHTMKQWVDLGIHTEACMTRPEICGSAGGAYSLWVKVTECSSICGILSSYSSESSGTSIRFSSQSFSSFVVVQDGYFHGTHPKSTEWTHIVLNYIGPDDGIRIYYNGTEEDRDTTKTTGFGPYSAGDGRIVVGRWFTDKDEKYPSLQVDEMIFFNRHLSSDEIASLATVY